MTTTQALTEMRATYIGTAGQWCGAVKEYSKIVAACPHTHRNRDSGPANARTCSAKLLRTALLNDPEADDWLIRSELMTAAMMHERGASGEAIEAALVRRQDGMRDALAAIRKHDADPKVISRRLSRGWGMGG